MRVSSRPAFRSTSLIRSGRKIRQPRLTDGVKYPVTVTRVNA